MRIRTLSTAVIGLRPWPGVALAAMKKLVDRGVIRSSDRVVVISTASGLKFVDFKVGYHDGRLVDVHVRRLRTKVESDAANPRHVVTVRGLGYKLQG